MHHTGHRTATYEFLLWLVTEKAPHLTPLKPQPSPYQGPTWGPKTSLPSWKASGWPPVSWAALRTTDVCPSAAPGEPRWSFQQCLAGCRISNKQSTSDKGHIFFLLCWKLSTIRVRFFSLHFTAVFQASGQMSCRCPKQFTKGLFLENYKISTDHIFTSFQQCYFCKSEFSPPCKFDL